MKKLITKTLFIAFLCSVVMPNIMQAGDFSGEFLSSAIPMQANLIASWGKSASTRLMSGLRNHSAVVSGLLYGKRAAMVVGAGAAIYGAIKIDRWFQSKPKYDYVKLYNFLKNENESKAVEIFESDAGKQYMSGWSIPMTGIKFICRSKKIEYTEGFKKHLQKKIENSLPKTTLTSPELPRQFWIKAVLDRDEIVRILGMTNRYLEYLKQPWVTKRDVSFGLGGAVVAGIALKLVGKL